MAKYRKKPIIIEAVEYHPFADIPGVIEIVKEVHEVTGEPTKKVLKAYVQTLEGRMDVNIGDWIITGVKGEIYPCKPDIFEETYEKVED